MDFFRITEEEVKKRGGGTYISVYPSFLNRKWKDLMSRGKDFYAVYDYTTGFWSRDLYRLQELVDQKLVEYVDNMPEERRALAIPQLMQIDKSQSHDRFLRIIKNNADNYHQLDQKLVFADTEVKREDYATRRLSYSIREGDISAYQEMMSVLFEPEELRKLEWGVGAVLSGDAKYIQKFFVLSGAPGTGKSTYIDLIEMLFEGYTAPFVAKDLGSASKQFALSAFRNDPLVAFEHDGDMSKIQDNSVFNSVVSHEEMLINEKFKAPYRARINAMLFVGTNSFVKITDPNSGLMRRLIDVSPTGDKLDFDKYIVLKERLRFELGAIAHHCLDLYLRLGKNYYGKYTPFKMLYGTNAIHNFMDNYYFEMRNAPYIQIYDLYKQYVQYATETNTRYVIEYTEFTRLIHPYFKEFRQRTVIDDKRVRNVAMGLKTELFEVETYEEPNGFDKEEQEEIVIDPIVLDQEESILDDILADCPAQYASDGGTPTTKWVNVKTTLRDLDTSKLHYVQPPDNHIVIDFDLVNADLVKDRELNLKAAESWPPTYAEYSRSGAGLHLHYIYHGDVEELSRVFDEGIEVKVFVGGSSLRRIRGLSNNLPIAELNGGLPLKEKRMIDDRVVKTERGLRALIERNLRKEIHPGTKPSMDFIHKILTDAYDSGLQYDIRDMESRITNFAMNSTNQAPYCLRLLKQLKLKSEGEDEPPWEDPVEERIAYFDVEVFPNLFIVGWKFEGDSEVVTMINPSTEEIAELLKLKLVGFNNRKYDNHILYGAYMGLDNSGLYELSKRIVSGDRTAMYGQAYGLSYTDVYDYSSKKQSLKKFQIELGIRHLESPFDWDKPVPEDRWDEVAEYNRNDVISTEKVAESRKQDFMARQILAELSGLNVNASTNQHSTRIIFGKERRPQGAFNYTDLSEMFPGYVYDMGVSTYRDIEVGEGGFVYSEPGMYENVTTFDVASMHPASIIALNLFGDLYTSTFKELVDARLAIKHEEYSKAEKMLGGILRPYLQDHENAKGLSNALKIVINSVYGLTAARFENPFRDIRNKDNIVAKRGALFMVDLLKAVQEKGYQVVHIKTDSIKVVDADPELEEFIISFGKSYGYDFETESTYDRFLLVNDAVFVALEDGKWEAVGAQFQHPVVYKTIFSKEPITFDDYVEVKNVTTSLWLEFDDADDKQFVGRSGAFVPVLEGGGRLLREKDGAFHSATGAKDHLWREAEVEREKNSGKTDNIDMSYFNALINAAYEKMEEFGDVEWFLS